MRMTTLNLEGDVQLFVGRASTFFKNNKKVYTYTDGHILPGVLFALRYGLGNDCVIVFRISEELEPTNYQNCIDNDFPEFKDFKLPVCPFCKKKMYVNKDRYNIYCWQCECNQSEMEKYYKNNN